MKTQLSILALALTSLFYTGCRKDHDITQERETQPFSGISIGVRANVYVVPDSITQLIIIGPQFVLDRIESKVIGGDLRITYDRKICSHREVDIEIRTPDINKLELNGSGSLTSYSVIKGKSLSLEVSGSGNMSVKNAEVDALSVKVSGSGNVSVSEGICDSESIEINGSGDVEALAVKSQKSNCRISGSGNMTVSVESYLFADISGSGDIRYKGYPVIDQHISGSGKLIQIH